MRGSEPSSAAELQQPVRPQRSGRHDHAARALDAAFLAQPRARAHAFDLVAVASVGRAERADVDDGAFGHHPRAALLGEVQVVLDERVLGAVRAADHAAPAQLAAGAVGPLAAEERVRHGLARPRRRRCRRACVCRCRRRPAPRRARAAAGRRGPRAGFRRRRACAALRRSAARARSPSRSCPPTGGPRRTRFGGTYSVFA